MNKKYFLTSSLSRKFIAGGLAAVFGAVAFSSYAWAMEDEHCCIVLWNKLTDCQKKVVGGIFLGLASCWVLVFLGFVLPYVIRSAIHDSKLGEEFKKEKNSKKESSQGEESNRKDPEDETQILENKQYAPLIVRLALRVTMMAAGAAAAVALTKKFSGVYKNSNSLESEKCDKLKKSGPEFANVDKAESVPPLSHEVNDGRKKEQIKQKFGDKNN